MNGVSDQWLDARAQCDLERLAALTADGATWHSPVNGTVHGRAAVVEQVRAGYENTDQFSTETLANETRGERTVAHVRNQGHRRGKQLDSLQWLMIQTRDGLVSDIDVRVDDPEDVEQFWSD